MGRAKQQMMEAESRGWWEPDGFVCDKCVEDDYLKDIIRENVSRQICDYCGRRTRAHSAAPVSALMEPIIKTVLYYYNDPMSAGVPSDEGYFVLEPTDTREVLMSLSFECHDDLFEDIASAFVNDSWVPAAGGNWAAPSPSEALSASWSNFVRIVKREVRYFFSRIPVSRFASPEEYSPQQLLPIIGHLVKELGLVTTFPVGTSLFRVRERDERSNWELNGDQMGPPPSDRAAAGRMNPAGISYLYLAFEQNTALAEVLAGPPCGAAIAKFIAQKDLLILDLTALPSLPSIFDDAQRESREGLLFLRQFVEEISEPVRKDGREHVEYVPSQVVSEYFALVFRPRGHRPLDGIAYPSAVRPGGKNIVLFPKERGTSPTFDQVVFQEASEVTFSNWAELSAAL